MITNSEMTEEPTSVVDQTAICLFSLAANLESRTKAGEEIRENEITAIIERLKDHAADLQLAASRLRG